MINESILSIMFSLESMYRLQALVNGYITNVIVI
jgi:hypothetical protein